MGKRQSKWRTTLGRRKPWEIRALAKIKPPRPYFYASSQPVPKANKPVL